MTPAPLVRYRSADEDSARWHGFAFRDGDIVISTRSKSGTTWVQMICALLVLQTTELPEPLGLLSPWLDWVGTPVDDVYARLAAQDHRRIIKSHTPLDGIPDDERATYIVVGRHPLDTAVSLYHQGDNIDRARLRQLTGQPEPATPEPARPPLHEWLVAWTGSDADPVHELDTLPGVLWHATDAWSRRDRTHVLLVHYDDLSSDLAGEMGRLAAALGITVAPSVWPSLVEAARFEAMRTSAQSRAPDPADILRDRARFFRRGSSGAGREVLTSGEWDAYIQRVATMAAPDVVSWLHHDAHRP